MLFFSLAGQGSGEEVFMEDTENSEFDQIIGAIEDIAISDDFQALQTGLLEKYYHHFEVISITQTSSKKGVLHELL